MLICAGDGDRAALWVKSHDSLSQERNYTVNPSGRRLTNDDSGIYQCRNSVADGTEYYFIHINVLGEEKTLERESDLQCQI